MTRRDFLLAFPASAGLAGCVALDPRWADAPLAAAAWAESTTAFAFDLFAQLRRQSGNLVCSPICIATSLALAAAGAGGETRDDIDRALHWGGDPDALHPAVAALERQLAVGMAASGCELRVAYGLWADKSLPITKEFRSIAQKQYGGGLQTTDFAQAEIATSAINSWAEMQTAFKVKDLIKADAVPPETKLVLASAGYFKGAWAPGRFPPAAASYGSFQLMDGSKSTAFYLRQTAWLRYAESEKWQAIELPHAGSALRMLVLVPPAPSGLPAIEAGLNVELFQQILEQLKSEAASKFVTIALPRFKLSTSVALTAALASMGLGRVFQSGDADFSRLTSTTPIALHGAAHKAGFEVNASGASPAITARGKTSVRLEPDPNPIVVAVDRPFLFAVRDAVSGSVLFLGRVEKP